MHSWLLPLGALALQQCLVLGANLDTPSGWRKPTNVRTLADRQSLSANALARMHDSLNSGTYQFNGITWWQSANAWAPFAERDWISGTRTYYNDVSTALDAIYNAHNAYYANVYNDDAMWWATTSLYAYRAYGDAKFLNRAVATWNQTSKYVVTAADVSSHSHSGKSFSLQPTCGGATMQGGVFWQTSSGDAAINSITTGLYMTLSAYLAQITGTATYKSAAISAAQWIVSHTWDNNRMIVLDTVYANDCSRLDYVFSYNSGKFIEGLGPLYDITGDAKYRDWAANSVSGALQNGPWHGSNGVITEGSENPASNNDDKGFRAVLMRGLYEMYWRGDSGKGYDPNIRNIIRAYVNVQFNSLIDTASNGNHQYSPSWTGPFYGPYSWGQFAVLDPLNAAIGVN